MVIPVGLAVVVDNLFQLSMSVALRVSVALKVPRLSVNIVHVQSVCVQVSPH
jgi:hypothetical protein